MSKNTNTNPDPARQIVIAWVDTVERFNPQTYRIESQSQAFACMWCVKGRDQDVKNAQAYVERDHRPEARVYVYDPLERNPLQRAREEITEEVTS